MRRLAFMIFLCLLWGSWVQAATHPKVTLKDQNGRSVTESGFPVSVRKSCGLCHNIDYIATGYHFQQGRLALLDSQVYQKNYWAKYTDKTGKPLLPSRLDPVIDGGMYGNLTLCPHPTPLGAVTAANPSEIGMPTPKWCAHCGICHVGGGPMEKDRNDHWLYGKTRIQIERQLKAGTIPGDYVIWNSKEKQFVPFAWNRYGIHNVGEPSCFLCHSKRSAKDRSDLFRYRLAFINHYFAAADTLGGGLAGSYDAKTGKLAYDMSIDMDKDKPGIQIGDNIIGEPSDTTCAQCHAGWTDDIDEDGQFTAKDMIIQLLDLKFVQPDTAKEAWVWNYNENDKDKDGVAKRIDIHEEMGIGCIDCHSPVGDTTRRRPSHDFAKGDTGPLHRVRWHQLAGSLRCQNCHENAAELHRPVFGPASNVNLHLQKLSCTLCHISKKYGFEAKLIDETEPLCFAAYDPKTRRVSEEDVFIGMSYLGGDPKNGSYADLALFPVKGGDGNTTWQYKPVNAVGLPYFVENTTGSFKALGERYLLQVLKTDAGLATFYITVGSPSRIGKQKYLNLQPNVGVMAKNKALNSGKSHLAYTLPNYIDVNLDNKYDAGDVIISDDTSLAGKGKDGIPEINTLKEVQAAIATIRKVLARETGKKQVAVKLKTTFHPFSMSHNVRPKSQALRCVDCHGEEGKLSGHMFTSTATLYYPYDPKAVEAGYVELNSPQTLSQAKLAEKIKGSLQREGFGKER